ncbi:ABC transporter substrate-binding protein [Rhodoligotrophos defluvii]|uniref:ABC transporter substrate-binding protein n=1 Tax=Rhodoligotrophos defluvii TaxID=2561934 RepID=UPI0010C98021|nr:ABC transporter substrate-binding protein [Rhodoligotrophos defluvii]
MKESTHKARISRWAGSLAAAAVAALVSMAPLTAQAQEKTLVIGCSLPLSGPLVGFGEPMKQGAELAVETYNASEALPEAKFVLQCYDSKADPKETINIGERLADQADVIASISDFSSTATMAAADTYERAGLVQLTPSASHPDLTKMNEWMFRASETVDVYVPPMADFIVDKLGKKKVAVMQVQTDWGVAVANAFIKQLEERGGEVVQHSVYKDGTTDFRAIITQLKRAQPEAIYLAMLEEEAANFAKQLQQLGMGDVPVVDSAVGVTPRSVNLAGGAMDGWYLATIFNPNNPDPNVQSFIKAYEAKYNRKADVWSAYGFDAATLIMQAATRAWPDVTRERVRDELANNTKDFKGANGDLSIDPETREVSRQHVFVSQVKDGNIETLAEN